MVYNINIKIFERMNKMKKQLATIGCVIISLGLIITIVIVEFFPFGPTREINLPNTTISIYNKDATIKNKNDFILFLKKNTDKYDLRIFKDSNNNIDWNEVSKSIKTDYILWRKCYILWYTPERCNKYILKVTSNGHVYDYQSCGK